MLPLSPAGLEAHGLIDQKSQPDAIVATCRHPRSGRLRHVVQREPKRLAQILPFQNPLHPDDAATSLLKSLCQDSSTSASETSQDSCAIGQAYRPDTITLQERERERVHAPAEEEGEEEVQAFEKGAAGSTVSG